MSTHPSDWSQLHEGRPSAMIEIAKAAGDHTLRYFRGSDLVVDAKQDDSPVTIADREAEQLVRQQITRRFPSDTIEGEEFSEQSGTSAYRWIVDPIDGTKSFICGVPLYSTLLALECDGEPLGGVIVIPALDETVAAVIGNGCWYRQGSTDWTPAAVSERTDLSEAVFVTSQVDSFGGRGSADAYQQLESKVRITRSWGDGYGYLLVATGRADIMIDPICNPWDVAAILPVIVESGGRFTDWMGDATTRGGDGVGTNANLHDQVLALLRN